MTNTPESAPTYRALIDAVNRMFESGITASESDATELRAAVEKLLAKGRGSTTDSATRRTLR